MQGRGRGAQADAGGQEHGNGHALAVLSGLAGAAEQGERAVVTAVGPATVRSRICMTRRGVIRGVAMMRAVGAMMRGRLPGFRRGRGMGVRLHGARRLGAAKRGQPRQGQCQHQQQRDQAAVSHSSHPLNEGALHADLAIRARSPGSGDCRPLTVTMKRTR